MSNSSFTSSPHSQDELYAWLRLSLEPGIGSVTAKLLLSVFGLPEMVYKASVNDLSLHISQKLAWQLHEPATEEIQTLIEQTFEWLKKPANAILTLADSNYPSALFETHDPPILLYCTGNLEALSKPMIAIVGSRNPTHYGTDNAQVFAKHLATEGWCVLSGLAHGIDAAAHEGALQSQAPACTIAVMGTGIDRIYPARNRDLAMRIREKGLLLSELPLGTGAQTHHFPKRNRIVAGLAAGVLVVEAAKQSGSLITAKVAAEIGKEVFSIPGSIHSPLSKGCHQLIRQGAKLVEVAEDIHEELRAKLGFVVGQSASTKLNMSKPHDQREFGGNSSVASLKATQRLNQADINQQTDQVLALLQVEPLAFDALLAQVKGDLADLSACLLALELAGLIKKADDGKFYLVSL